MKKCYVKKKKTKNGEHVFVWCNFCATALHLPPPSLKERGRESGRNVDCYMKKNDPRLKKSVTCENSGLNGTSAHVSSAETACGRSSMPDAEVTTVFNSQIFKVYPKKSAVTRNQRPPVSYHEDFNSMHLKARPRNVVARREHLSVSRVGTCYGAGTRERE